VKRKESASFKFREGKKARRKKKRKKGPRRTSSDAHVDDALRGKGKKKEGGKRGRKEGKKKKGKAWPRRL